MPNGPPWPMFKTAPHVCMCMCMCMCMCAGLAVDWISRNVYITDPGRELIEVIGLDTKMRYSTPGSCGEVDPSYYCIIVV